MELDRTKLNWTELDRVGSNWTALDRIGLCSLRAAEKMEESVSLLEKVLGQTDAHAEEVKRRAKVSGG